ncbi:hypothetical protein L537_4411 [Bordetella hinzii 1277]|nr:hypothetical protein L537_4411 [Bordetella hinzii 1277]
MQQAFTAQVTPHKIGHGALTQEQINFFAQLPPPDSQAAD